jgi:aspartyl-tRNA(Asn)/glutamyl-tRNA(Gln) amidotransferase subunit A
MPAEEIVQDCLRTIDALDPSLGAFVELAADALDAARASDARRRRKTTFGDLDGVPIAIKDNIDVAGMHAAAGMQPLRARRPARDAACIALLRRQGAVFPGKTLMDEAAFGALGDNPWFGRCHNPARHGCTPGGSSGGSAAAVAAGLCAAALGTDTLGSVRIPASYCGVVGYVPSGGLVDREGVMPLAPSFDRIGVLARTVADAADVAAAMATAIRIDAAPGVTLGVLRGLDSFVPGGILAAVGRAAQALGTAGHRLVDIDSAGFDWTAVRRAALLHVEIEGARALAPWLDDPAAELSASLRAALELGRRADAERVERAARHLDEARARIRAWLERAQVIVLPATPQRAFAFDAEVPANQADLAVPASLLGLPALSIPAPTGARELPVGVQLFAAHGADPLLLGVAADFVSR